MNPSIVSLPSQTSSSDSLQKTNTIAVTSLPKSYFEAVILDVLRTHFSSYGEINQWVPLPGFSRIIIVYNEDDHAELAKQHCDPIILDGTPDRAQVILRVYRADPNPLVAPQSDSSIPDANYLRPPDLEKNFLISPPGSPPVGWEPIREDPPNATPLAEDLMTALRKLQVHAGKEVLLDPHEGSGVSVFVEDCDADPDEDAEEEIAEEDWVYGETAPARTKWRPIPTAMPPMQSAIVA